jgi:pimeloyl-ACP methyl ester carboxylesterase
MTDAQPTLVLISGLLSDAVVWQPVVNAFSETLPVVTVDLKGGGSFSDMAANILAATPGPLIVVGHSMGARVALEVLRLAPDRIEKLAMLDTGVHPLQDGETASRQVLLDLAHNEGMAAMAAKWLPPMVHPDRLADDALMDTLTAMVLRADATAYERQVRAMLARPEVEALLPLIRCPVLLIVGRQDTWSPLARHEQMRDRISNARLVIIEDAGHFAPIERPDAMIAALGDWIDTA